MSRFEKNYTTLGFGRNLIIMTFEYFQSAPRVVVHVPFFLDF